MEYQRSSTHVKRNPVRNTIQYNRIGKNAKAMQTLNNAAMHVKNLLSGILENADPEDKKAYDIDDELKRIKENKLKNNFGFFTLAGDESDKDLIGGWGKSKTKGINNFNSFFPKTKTKKKKKPPTSINFKNYTVDEDSFGLDALKSLNGFTKSKHLSKIKESNKTIRRDSGNIKRTYSSNSLDNGNNQMNTLISLKNMNGNEEEKTFKTYGADQDNNKMGNNDSFQRAFSKKSNKNKNVHFNTRLKTIIADSDEEDDEEEKGSKKEKENGMTENSNNSKYLSPMTNKFIRKKPRNKSVSYTNNNIIKDSLIGRLNKLNREENGNKVSKRGSNSPFQTIINNGKLFSQLYANEKLNQTQILNNINFKIKESISDSNITSNVSNKELRNNKRNQSHKTKNNGELKKRKSEENDENKFIPLNDKKFKNFCTNLKNSLILTPNQEESKENDSDLENTTPHNGCTHISSNVKGTKLQDKTLINKSTIKKTRIKMDNDNNIIEDPNGQNDDTQSQKEYNLKIKEMKFRCLNRNKLVYDSLSDEEVDEELEGSFYIEPKSLFKFYWDMILTIFSIYGLVEIPISIGFDKFTKPNLKSFFLWFEVFIDIIFMCDIVLSFFTAYYNFDEILITRLNPIAINYLKGWFTVDLLSGFPFQILLIIIRSSSSLVMHSYNGDEIKYLELFKLLRIIKLFKICLSNFFITTFQGFMTKFDQMQTVFTISLFFIFFISCVHFLSCTFIFLGKLDYPNWISSQNFNMDEKKNIYVTSFYYICATIFSIGYGDVVSVSPCEKIFNLFLLIVGIMIYSWAVTSLSNYVQTVDSNTREYQKRVAILEQIRVTHEKMPPALYDKISRFLLYKFKTEKSDKNDIIDSLPITLRNKLIMQMYRGIINNFIFFKNFDNTDFIIRVILAFKPILGTKNERLVNEGDYIDEIIFVKKGSLALEISLPVIIKDETIQKIQSIQHQKSSLNNFNFNTRKSFAQNPDKLECIDNEQLSFSNTKTRKSFLNSSNQQLQQPIPEIKSTQQYIKIIEIRQNEHFGDILMFLNKRSPLSVKVKSKVAEIFLLKKKDAVEISVSFPKIWKKIIRKSLFNMDQIERLINKSRKFFFIYNEGKGYKKNKNFKNYYHKDFTKKNTYLNSKKLINALTLNSQNCELQSIPGDEEEGELSEIKSDEESNEEEENENDSEIESENDDENGNENGNENNNCIVDEIEEKEEEDEQSSSFEKEREKSPNNSKEVIKEEEESNEENSTVKDNSINLNIINSKIDSSQSNSSGDKTVLTNINNNNVILIDTSDDNDEEKSKEKHSTNLITETQSVILPYDSDDINKEQLPFEGDININNTSISNIIPSSYNTSSYTNSNNNIIFKEDSNQHTISSLIDKKDKKDFFNFRDKEENKNENGNNLISEENTVETFGELTIIKEISFSLIGIKKPKPNNPIFESPRKRVLLKSKSLNMPQDLDENEKHSVNKEEIMNKLTKKEVNNNIGLKEGHGGHKDDNIQAQNNKEITLQDLKKGRKSFMINENPTFGNKFNLMKFNNLNKVDDKKKDNNSNMLDVINKNIVKNSQNLNNPESFYSNVFLQMMSKENKK